MNEEEIEKEIAKILAGGDMYGDHVYVTEKLKELIIRERGSVVYEVDCYYGYDKFHSIGFFDDKEKAEKAKEQFLLDISEEINKYPCPFPRLKNMFIKGEVIEDEDKWDRLKGWYYNTPYGNLYECTKGFITIRELKINEYHFLPIRESNEEDKDE